MKNILILAVMIISSYASASFDGFFYCPKDTGLHIIIEHNKNNPSAASVTYLQKNRIFKIKDAILFDYKEDEFFNIKYLTVDGNFEMKSFTLDQNNLSILIRGNEIKCERVVEKILP